MPRVVPDQKEKFENDEIFRKLSIESEIRYTGHRDRPMTERRARLVDDCCRGQVDVVFVNTGINLELIFDGRDPRSSGRSPKEEEEEEEEGQRRPLPTPESVDFGRDPEKVYLKSKFLMNGVCVTWKGSLDLRRLDGSGRLEYDDDSAQIENAMLRDQIEQYNRQLSNNNDNYDRRGRLHRSRYHRPSRHHHRRSWRFRPNPDETMEETEVNQTPIDMTAPTTTTATTTSQ